MEKNWLFSTAARQIWEWPGKDTSLSLKNTEWTLPWKYRWKFLFTDSAILLGLRINCWDIVCGQIDLVCYNCCAVQPTSIQTQWSLKSPQITVHWTKVYICYWHCLVMKVVKLDLTSIVQHHTNCIGGVSIYENTLEPQIYSKWLTDIGGVSSGGNATFCGLPLSGSWLSMVLSYHNSTNYN